MEGDNLKNRYTFIDDSERKIEKLDENDLQIPAINGLLDYLNQTQKIKLEHINTIKMYTVSKYMILKFVTV